MTPEDLDRILESEHRESEDRLEASSGFTMKVMEAVRQQASEPARPRFPWWQLGAGVAACCVVAWEGARLILAIPVPLAPLAGVAPEIGYAAGALLVSLGITLVPRAMRRS